MLESTSEFLRQAAEKTPVSSALNEMLRMADESSNQSPLKAEINATLPPDKWYTAKEAAKFLNMSESNFRGWRGRFNKEHSNESIKSVKKGKNQMYHHFDLERLKAYAAPRMKSPKDDDSTISLLDDLQPQQSESKNAPTVEAADLIIDDEFKNLIQPLNESEFK